MECIDDVDNFILRMQAFPLDGDSVKLDEILHPSLEAEERLRRTFVRNPDDPRLLNPFIGMANVFELPQSLRLTRARHISENTGALDNHYLMPIGRNKWSPCRRPAGAPAMVNSIDDFKANFDSFSMGVLRRLDWRNVVVAGGAALACLSPVPSDIPSGRHFHSKALRFSDIDLFIHGLDEDEAREKMLAVYDQVKKELHFETTCIRKANTVTIISQFPFRPVQIVLRLYRSPAEVLAGFDVDCTSVLFNGQSVYASPRAIVAIIRQCNTIMVTRRSPSYEYRLMKYNQRGYEIRYPQLKRDEIRESLFDVSAASELPKGLGRLILFEKMQIAPIHFEGLVPPELRKLEGNEPAPSSQQLKLNLSALGSKSWYDTGLVRISYGPQWDAAAIKRTLRSMQLRIDYLTQFDENGDQTVPAHLIGHHHGVFFGSMLECLAIICPDCPAAAMDPPYNYGMGEGLQGPLRFIKQNPGQQMLSGSFHPLNLSAWEEDAYRKWDNDESLPLLDVWPWPFYVKGPGSKIQALLTGIQHW